MVRAAGLLLHPTSLPGPEGAGTLGAEARAFVDFCAAASVSWWQVLPLGPPGAHGSPYMARSAMASNEALVDARTLVQQGVLEPAALRPLAGCPPVGADLEAVAQLKAQVLDAAHARFAAGAPERLRDALAAYRADNASWLTDYARFQVLRAAHGEREWTAWPAALRDRDPGELARVDRELAREIERVAFGQWLFDDQWSALRRHAHARGVSLLGDAPIFVAHDSAETWAHPELFFLDERGAPTVVAGVPPDYFSETGQLWGNPLYRWERMAGQGFRWWRRRVRRAVAQVDRLRIDHFRGFAQYWEIPAGAVDARAGCWVDGPGRALFDALAADLGGLPLLAEDLGLITPDVIALRDALELPGMAILQFAFGGGADNAYLPHNFAHSRLAVYTGTHDNDTTAGWYASLTDRERHHVRTYLRASDPEAPRELMRLAWASTADLAVAPVQDVLGLGSEARMNVPGRAEGNWSWRLRPGQLTAQHAAPLREWASLFGRAPRPAPAAPS